MLEPRIYRAGFMPAVLAFVVVAFSLGDQPRAATTTFAPDAFDGDRAALELERLAADLPDRRAGGAGDVALARRVRAVFGSTFERASDGPPTVVTTRSRERTLDGTRELETIVARRVGLSSRRIVVVAHRDAAQKGSIAELSGTATLLELARVFEGRRLNKTLEFVSTSGGSGGAAGAREWAKSAGPGVDAVIVIGDLAGGVDRRPWIVPWSNDSSAAPVFLRRTLAAAVRAEVGESPGAPSAVAQWARLAVPLTVSEQGEIGDAGLPAVLLQVSGERGPAGSRAISRERLGRFGRAVLRSISALDAARITPAERATAPALLVRDRILEGWAIALLVGALILPVGLVAVDALARVRRRREPVLPWLGWVAACALPFAVAFLLARLLELVGAIDAAPGAPVPPDAVAPGAPEFVVLALLGLVALLCWVALRPLAARAAGAVGPPRTGGAAVAVLLALLAATIVVWLGNPFAAALMLPALHLWLLVLEPDLRLRRPPALALIALGLVPIALVCLYYARVLGVGPLEGLWTGVRLIAGGHIGPLSSLVWALLLGLVAAVVHVCLARTPLEPEVQELVTRGPSGYAGPGSLGGTDSALRW